MPKATLEFNLPDETGELNNALKANRLSAAAWNFSEYIRRRFKHETPANEDVAKIYEEIKTKFYEEFDDDLLE